MNTTSVHTVNDVFPLSKEELEILLRFSPATIASFKDSLSPSPYSVEGKMICVTLSCACAIYSLLWEDDITHFLLFSVTTLYSLLTIGKIPKRSYQNILDASGKLYDFLYDFPLEYQRILDSTEGVYPAIHEMLLQTRIEFFKRVPQVEYPSFDPLNDF